MGPAPVFGYHVIIFNCHSSAPDDFIVVSLLPGLAQVFLGGGKSVVLLEQIVGG